MAAGHDVAASSRRKEAIFSPELAIKAKRETKKTRAAGSASYSRRKEQGWGRMASSIETVSAAGVGGASTADRQLHIVSLRCNQSALGLMKHSESKPPPLCGLTFALPQRDGERHKHRGRERARERVRGRAIQPECEMATG